MKSAYIVLFLVVASGLVGVSGCSKKDTPAPGAVQQVSESKPAHVAVSFEELKKDYDAADKKYREEVSKEAKAKIEAHQKELDAAGKAVKDAKNDDEKKAAQSRLREASIMPGMKLFSPADGPGATYSPQFLAFAVENPKDQDALEALKMAILTGGGPTGNVGIWDGAINALQADHVLNPEIKRAVQLLRMLAGAGMFDERANVWLRDVLARNPDRRARARTCQALAQGRERAAETGEQFKNAEFRKMAEADFGGTANVERLIEDQMAAAAEAVLLNGLLRDKYDDVCPDLSLGKAAPEVMSKTVDDKPVKLSALKGQVVVLDIWATWCGPCRAMIPHEREMVERLKDKPFTLVSISVDEDKETLTEFLAKEPMPWTHWWNGHEDGIIEDWNVESYPTIYVLDARGVIRHKDLRGEELEKAVNELLEEIKPN